MKILVFADLHGSPSALKKIKKKAKECDLILCCGDFTIFGHDMEEMLREFDNIGKPMLIIPGNHEFGEDVEELCMGSKNIKYIDGAYHEVSDLFIVGIEGNGFTMTDKNFERRAGKLRKIIASKKSKKYILMTHAPPFGTKHDRLIEEHCGNKSVRKFIEQTRPVYAFCGHIHENNYTKDKVGTTKTMNPGPEGRIIKL